MPNDSIKLETLFTDYCDLFCSRFGNDQKYKTSRVLWINPVISGGFKEKVFNKPNFLNKISVISGSSFSSIKEHMDVLSQLETACITPNIQLFRRDHKTINYLEGKKAVNNYIDRQFAFNNTLSSSNFDADANGLNANGKIYGFNPFVDKQKLVNPNRFSAGIKNIDYVFAGTNPVESERSIDVTITFSFSSFDALIGKHVSSPGVAEEALIRRQNNTVIDPTDWVNSDGTKNEGVTRNFLSLITYPPSREQIINLTNDSTYYNDSSIYVPNYFQIFLKLGWRMPETNEVKSIFQKFGRLDFLEAINKGIYDKLLVLNLVNHELVITEESYIELKVNYIGSFETDLMARNELDFLINAFLKAQQDNVSTVDQERSLNNLIEYKSRCLTNENDKKSYQEQIDGLEKDIKEKRDKTKQTETELINAYYSEFISYVTTENLDNLKVFKLNSGAIEKYDNNISITPKNRDEDIFNQLIQNTNLIGSSQEFKDNVRSEAEKATEKLREDLAKKQSEEGGTPSATDAISGATASDLRDKALKDYENEYVFYFTFGQLLDMVLRFTKEKSQSTQVVGNLNVILGDFVYTTRTYDSKKVILPIHAVPITLNSFLVWFKDNVSSKTRTNYPLRDLINDMLVGLLLPALKGESTKTNSIGGSYAPFVEFIEHDFDFVEKPAGVSSPSNDTIFINNRGIINEDTVNLIKKTKTTNKKTIMYISLVERGAFSRVYNNINTDRRDGISHFFVGHTRGLIKSIKFKRIDQPGLKEAKATKDGFIPLNQLRDLYNADITMFGNHYYYPGQLIYVHPFEAQLGAPSKKGTLANIMGIGGYYNVIKVSSVISNDNYETVLECVWNSSGEERPKETGRLSRCEALLNTLIIDGDLTSERDPIPAVDPNDPYGYSDPNDPVTDLESNQSF